jgi:hypothetical protein
MKAHANVSSLAIPRTDCLQEYADLIQTQAEIVIERAEDDLLVQSSQLRPEQMAGDREAPARGSWEWTADGGVVDGGHEGTLYATSAGRVEGENFPTTAGT